MVHKLLVDAGIDMLPKSIDDRYREFLHDFEIVRGVNTRFRFRIKNIGESIFPGGKLANDTIAFGNLLGTQSIEMLAYPDKKSIPELKPNETHIFKTEFFSQLSGALSIKLTIESNDKDKVEHYQNEGFPPSKEWFALIMVLDRENLEQILLLRELVKKWK
jgi:hypothetical protein